VRVREVPGGRSDSVRQRTLSGEIFGFAKQNTDPPREAEHGSPPQQHHKKKQKLWKHVDPTRVASSSVIRVTT
jgi:hypothetical protein